MRIFNINVVCLCVAIDTRAVSGRKISVTENHMRKKVQKVWVFFPSSRAEKNELYVQCSKWKTRAPIHIQSYYSIREECFNSKCSWKRFFFSLSFQIIISECAKKRAEKSTYHADLRSWWYCCLDLIQRRWLPLPLCCVEVFFSFSSFFAQFLLLLFFRLPRMDASTLRTPDSVELIH